MKRRGQRLPYEQFDVIVAHELYLVALALAKKARTCPRRARSRIIYERASVELFRAARREQDACEGIPF
jgi:hypothetical protein